MLEQPRDPLAILHVRLATRDVLDVVSVAEKELEGALLQDVPDRFPVDTSRLHRNVRDALSGEPTPEVAKIMSHGAELADPLRDVPAIAQVANADHDRLLVYVEPGTAPVDHFHVIAPPVGSGRRPKSGHSGPRTSQSARDRPVAAVSGWDGRLGQTLLRA